MSLRVAVDARVLGEEQTGVATYTRSLLSAMADLQPETEWILLSHRRLLERDVWLGTPPPHVRYLVIPFLTPMLVRPVWDHVLVPLALRGKRPGLWFSPLSVVPRWLGDVPSVVTIHDLAFLRFPDIQPPKYRAAWSRSLRRASRAATHAICVSQATRADWMDLLGGRSEAATVIHEGVDLDRFSPHGPDDSHHLKTLGLEPGYLLAVGTIEPRKNHEFLLDVYDQLRKSGETRPLVVVGGEGWSSTEVRARMDSMAPHVRRLGYVDRDAIPMLYRQAAMLLFPTRYEGFGLPILEALASGTPVVASDIAVCREVGGEASVYAQGDSRDAWAEAIDRVAESPLSGMDLRDHASGFTWRKAADKTWEVFEACAAIRSRTAT